MELELEFFSRRDIARIFNVVIIVLGIWWKVGLNREIGYCRDKISDKIIWGIGRGGEII